MKQSTFHHPPPERCNVRWNLKELRDSVQRVHGEARAKDAWECGQSIVKRVSYMQYHYQEVQRLVAPALEAPTHEVLQRYVLPNLATESQNFHKRKFEAEAHLVAFMQCGHAVLDTLGFVIFSALKFDKLLPSEAYLLRVQDLLPAGDLKDRGWEFLADPEIKYLSALVNHSKHRSVIGANMSVSFVDDDSQPHGLKFRAFEHKGNSYAARWADECTKTVFDRIQHHVMGVGPALNAQVAVTATLEIRK